MSQLPIESVLPQILNALRECQQVILKAPPGAGKSTCLPLHIMQQNLVSGKIIMLEPRRLAARNIARYLAKLLGEKVGEQIGYRVRGEAKVSSKTKLEIVTEGVMTRMIQSDPELLGVDLLIFDEFHERSIHADTSLAFSLEVQEAFREDLKILVMSATLEHKALKKLLPEAKFVESEGRAYPVEYRYAPLRPNDRLIPNLERQVNKLLLEEHGSILVFLPGIASIKQLNNALSESVNDVEICPLYGQLSFSEQQKAIEPCVKGQRKVVLATNIAETSLTIEGIRMVVDSGLERVGRFDLRSGVTKLEQMRVAQSSAEQRAGRAGRIEPGICIRLYSQDQLSQQARVPQPEVLHSDLSSLCMELSQWGAQNAEDLQWLDVPPKAAIAQGYALLNKLGLMDEQNQLSVLGSQVGTLGVEPRLAAMLLKAKRQSVPMLQTALCLVAIIEQTRHPELNISNLLYQLKKQRLTTQSVVINRARALAKQLGCTLNIGQADENLTGLCLATAYPDRIGQKRSNQTERYILANGHGALISSQEKLSESTYIVAVDLMRSNQDSSQIHLAAELDVVLLERYYPDLFVSKEVVDWDEAKGLLVAEKQKCIGKLILHRERRSNPDKTKLNQALINYIRRKGLQVLSWSQNSEALLERYRCGAQWFPEKKWPELSNLALVSELEVWLEPFMNGVTNVKSLQKINLSDALTAYLGWPLNQEVDDLLPTHYQFSTGTKKKIQYKAGKPPMLSVRMQEVFGEQSSPVIANGKKRIVLELLSPAQRPLQITADLEGFWKGAYKDVQKEMKGRYPKHIWPDDPSQHAATTKTKRQLNS